MAGLLDIPGIDPDTLATLQGLMGMMNPQESDLKKINADKWMNFGLGLMQARKGQELAGFGQAGMNALQQANQERTQLQTQRGQNLTQAMGLLQMAKANQGLQQDANLGKDIGNIFKGGAPAPTTLSGPPATFQQPGGAAALVSDAASGAPSPSNALPTQQQPAPPSPEDSVRATAAQYRQIAQAYAQAGPRYATQFKEYAAAADALEKQLEYSPDPRTMMDKNGQPVAALINKSGGIKQVQGYAPAVPIHFQDTGGGYQGLNSLTGAPIAGASGIKTATADARLSNALGYANLAESKRRTNLEYDLNPDGTPAGNTAAMANMVANYDTPFPQAMMYRKPAMGAELLAQVQKINPTYDAKNYPVAQATMTAFAKGQQGDTVRSLSVAMQHLDVLQQAATALNNGDYPLLNKLANAVGTQAGSSAPATYNAIAGVVGNEVVKAVVGSGGGVGDREKSQQILGDFNNPATVAGVVGGYKNLFAGQLNGLERQYQENTQRKDFGRFLSPEVQALRASQNSGAQGPARISSDAQYNALPKGAQYMAPDGSIRTKQ